MSDSLVRLIDESAVPDGEARCVRIDGLEPVAVFKVEGQYYVTQDTCTHATASLSQGWLEGHEVICPVHEGRFDIRDGRALCFPVTEPVNTFAVSIRDGAIWADLATARRI